MAKPKIEYDPQIIREHASRLYQYADSLIALGALLGAAPGGVVGELLGTTIGEAAYGAIFGLAAGVVVGALIGRNIGFKHRLQAQLALCQMQIEANTRIGVVRISSGDQPANVNAA